MSKAAPTHGRASPLPASQVGIKSRQALPAAGETSFIGKERGIESNHMCMALKFWVPAEASSRCRPMI